MKLDPWAYLTHHASIALVAFVAAVIFAELYRWIARATGRDVLHGKALSITIAAFVAGYGIWYLKYGETVSVQRGLGWDGIHFAAYAKDFSRVVGERGVSPYHAQKLLPPLLVHGLLRLTGKVGTDQEIIFFFRALTIAELTGAALLWGVISRNLHFSRKTEIFGAISLFANYAFLKFFYYDAVLVDASGFFLGMAMCAAFVTRHSWAMLVASLLGAFVIPSYTLVTGLLLFVFPRRDEPSGETYTKVRSIAGYAAALIAALLVAEKAIALHHAGRLITNDASQINPDLLPLSAVALVLMLASLWGPLVSLLPHPLALIRETKWLRVPIAIALFFGVRYAIAKIGAHPPPGSPGIETTPEAHIFCILLESIAKPFISLGSHVVFFGPLFLAFILVRRDALKNVWAHGSGLAGVFALFTFFSIDSESRHLVHLIPFIAMVTATAIDRKKIATRSFTYIYLVSALMLSKAWMVCESPPIGSGTSPFSWQRIFMNLGPWMSLESYGIQMAAIAVAFGALWMASRRSST